MSLAERAADKLWDLCETRHLLTSVCMTWHSEDAASTSYPKRLVLLHLTNSRILPSVRKAVTGGDACPSNYIH